jgi:hypothetical protein
LVRRRRKIVVHSKQKKKYKKNRNKGERRILLGLEHIQAMPFGMVAG